MKNLLLAGLMLAFLPAVAQKETNYLRATALFNQGKYADALPWYDRAVRANPKNADAYFYRFFSKCSLQKYAEALPDMVTFVNLRPRSAEGRYWLGRVHLDLKDTTAAQSNYQTAVAIDSSFRPAWKELILINKARQQWAAAIALQTQIVYASRTDFSITESLLGRADLHAEAGDLTQAAYDWFRAGYFVTTDSIVRLRAPGVKDMSPALTEIEKYLTARPTDHFLHYVAARLYLRLARFDSALAHVDRAIALKPEQPVYLYLKGLIRYDSGLQKDPKTGRYQRSADPKFRQEACVDWGVFIDRSVRNGLLREDFQQLLDFCAGTEKRLPSYFVLGTK